MDKGVWWCGKRLKKTSLKTTPLYIIWFRSPRIKYRKPGNVRCRLYEHERWPGVQPTSPSASYHFRDPLQTNQKAENTDKSTQYQICKRLNPLTAKLFNWNFHPLEVVSRWRDPQLQVSENYSVSTKWSLIVFKYCWLMSHFIFNMVLVVLNVLIKNKTPNISGTGG